jgi:uncharacterized protein YkwD
MRSRRQLAPLVLLTGLAILATAPAAASATCPNEAVGSALQTEATVSESILCLVNEERAAAGVGPVSRNAKLEQAALAHSNDMVSNGFFAHTSPAGVGFLQRVTSTGYTSGASSWIAGENLAWGSGSLSTPAEIVRGWMESPAHRDNLLRGQFREIGIGVVRGTPEDASDPDGVTVSSEYGYRGADNTKSNGSAKGKGNAKGKGKGGAKKKAKKARAAARKRSARRSARR